MCYCKPEKFNTKVAQRYTHTYTHTGPHDEIRSEQYKNKNKQMKRKDCIKVKLTCLGSPLSYVNQTQINMKSVALIKY